MTATPGAMPPGRAGSRHPWRFAAATRTGTSHTRDGLPCQDRHRCAVVTTADESVFVAVVADGAGSASESARGATYVCEEMLNQIAQQLPAANATNGPGWLTDCVDATRHGLLAEADRLGLPARELASTLLCAVVAEHWSAFAQIGDGAIVTPENGVGTWMWVFWPNRGEYANTTSFVTDSTAMEHLEVAARPGRQDEVAMFTDGLQHLVLHYELQQVHDPFFTRMLTPVRQSTAEGEDHKLSADLETYLGSHTVANRTDDDLTLVLASRLTEFADIGQID